MREEKKSLGDTMKEIFDDIGNIIKNNPEIAVMQLEKVVNDKEKEIEELRIKNRGLQSKIDYLEGQLSVYKSFINEED